MIHFRSVLTPPNLASVSALGTLFEIPDSRVRGQTELSASCAMACASGSR